MTEPFDIYLSDADFLLGQLAETPEHPDRDHMVQLAIAHALTSIALSLDGRRASREAERTLAVVQ